MLHPLAYGTSQKAAGANAITRGFGQHMIPMINLLLQIPKTPHWEGGDIILKINPLSTLYVSSKSNYVRALDFYKKLYQLFIFQ